jgi:hypothetical protein
MLINNEHGTFVVLEDKIFHIERSHIFNTGPISKEELKELESTSRYVAFKKNGQIHRDNDLPAVVRGNGTKQWLQNNLLHRDNDLPAIICTSGAKHWYQNNRLHRDNDLPAIIYADGEKNWYQNGIFIRREHANQQ